MDHINKSLRTLTSFQGDTLSGKGIDVAKKEDAGSASDGLVKLGSDSDLGLGVSVAGNVEAIDFHDMNACKISDPVHNSLLSDAAGTVQQHCTVQSKFRGEWVKSG